MKHLLTLFLVIALLQGCSSDPGIGESEESGVEQADSSDAFSATLVEGIRNGGMDEEAASETGNFNADPNQAITSSRQNAITTAVATATPAIGSITVTGVVQRQLSQQEQYWLNFYYGYVPDFRQPYTNMGSGFIISEDGLMVTNRHLIRGSTTEFVVVTSDGQRHEAWLLGSDELADIALLKIEADQPLRYLEFADSDEVVVGEWAIALGNSFALFDDGQPTVTVGVVSATNRDLPPAQTGLQSYVDMIQTDAAINPGNSGGPLLNSDGKVIGVNTAIYTGSDYQTGFVGIGFAIPSNRVQMIIDQLLANRQVALDFDPGMEYQSMTEELALANNLPRHSGLLVTSVNQDGPAYDCGVMPGDIIVKIGEKSIVSDLHAQAVLSEYEEGETMHLQLLRGQEYYQTEMLLRKRVDGSVSESETN